jgi:hypothetical protein
MAPVMVMRVVNKTMIRVISLSRGISMRVP